MLDVFTSSAFSTTALTAAVNKVPYIPGQVSRLGMFEENGVTKTTVAIEEREETLVLVETKPRGGPANQNVKDKRKVRNLAVPHIPISDTIMADEVQNVRAFGSESETQGVQMEIEQRQATMAHKLDATLEHHRLGAIKGQIMDADGSTVLIDLFSEFNVTKEAVVDFALGTATTKVRKKCNAVIRTIEDNLGGGGYGYIHCYCGSAFFDDLVDHDDTAKAYERWNDGEMARQRTARRTFYFAGILFEEYRGKVGSVQFVADDAAHFFPVGVQGLFITRFAPADYMETVNTIGLARYSKIAVDEKFQKSAELEVQTNPLNLCTRPKVLMEGKRA